MKRPQFSLLELLNVMFVLSVIAAYVGIALRSVQPKTSQALVKGSGAMLYVDEPTQ